MENIWRSLFKINFARIPGYPKVIFQKIWTFFNFTPHTQKKSLLMRVKWYDFIADWVTAEQNLAHTSKKQKSLKFDYLRKIEFDYQNVSTLRSIIIG